MFNVKMLNGELINFARNKLKTKISTSSLCVDGHEVENLIEDNIFNSFQKKPFMAEYYVKCPVTVVLCFPCLIDISAIVLGRRVSLNHYTKSLDIFTAYLKPIKQYKTDATIFPCNYSLDLTKDTAHGSFNFVGNFNERFHESNVSVIVFQNQQHSILYQRENQDYASVSMKPLVSTRSCSHLMIKITYASLPVIKHLEVWGTVSCRNSSPVLIAANKMLNMLNIVDKKNNTIFNEINVNKKEGIAGSSTIHLNDEEKIPDEFIDPITYDVMTYPLLLPSGKNIDKTTYDKFISEEGKLGRVPCDPFTGVAFHDNKQPIPNMVLKSRIDKFLLQNKELHVVKCNVVGTKDKSIGLLDHVSNAVKINFSDDVNQLSNKRCISDLRDNNQHQTSNKKQKTSDEKSHNLELSDSLDSALSKTISLLPLSNSLVKGNGETKCEKCDIKDKGLLYKLQCLHVYCKACLSVLLSIDNMKCSKCSKPFQKSDVVKIR